MTIEIPKIHSIIKQTFDKSFAQRNRVFEMLLTTSTDDSCRGAENRRQREPPEPSVGFDLCFPSTRCHELTSRGDREMIASLVFVARKTLFARIAAPNGKRVVCPKAL